MNKIKTGDTVIVLTGKDKRRSGKVIKLLGARALVEGVNMIKKHVKPDPKNQVQGGIVEKESAIHLSNLAILNPTTNKADRVGFKILKSKNDSEHSRKARYFKSDNELVDA